MKYIGVHEHEYGITLYPFEYAGSKYPCVHEAIRLCGADVEPHKGESFILESVDHKEMVIEASSDELEGIFPE